jgi:hypothetical protein
MASHSFSKERHGRSKSQQLLRLASVSKAAFHDIHSTILLPDLNLYGIKQIVSFSRMLSANTLNLRYLASRIRRLTVCRSASTRYNGRGSLYDDIEDMAKFERATLTSLRTILAFCTDLQYLSLEMTARVVDLRWPDDAIGKQVMKVCSSLKEFVTMLSLYGGDMNERLWDPSIGQLDMKSSRWDSLTHLQLHGPRFRMTAMTALALCGLPKLSHLCLIMPWIIQAIPESVTSEVLARHAHHVERATDATGQETVLQLLYSGLGRQLKKLVLVCHDAEGYVGSVTKLGPLFRALHWWEEDSWQEGRSASSTTLLTLVTAQLRTDAAQSVHFHPSMLSRWMMQRAQKQQHWSFSGVIQESSTDECFSLEVESWTAPVAYDSQSIIETIPSQSSQWQSTINYGSTASSTGVLRGGIDDLD